MTGDATRIPDSIARRLVEHFTPAERVEVALVAGAMGFMNRLNDSLRIPLEESAAQYAGIGLRQPNAEASNGASASRLSPKADAASRRPSPSSLPGTCRLATAEGRRPMQNDELDPEKIMEDYVRNRGDIFEEWHFMVRHVPLTIVRLHDISGYILKHENKTAPDQELSFVFRELIALCQLSTKGEPRFAANHVRRLYRAGITNTVIFEAAEAFSTAVGHANIALVAQSILLANDPAYPFGKLPEGGEPKSVTPFPEMELGWEASEPLEEGLLHDPDWQYAAEIDPEFARRTAAYVDHCLTDRRPERVLSPGARTLIALAALCARGEQDLAAEHVRRAYAYGFTRRQVLEAISCVQNMTGAASTKVGLRAMRQVEGENRPSA